MAATETEESLATLFARLMRARDGAPAPNLDQDILNALVTDHDQEPTMTNLRTHVANLSAQVQTLTIERDSAEAAVDMFRTELAASRARCEVLTSAASATPRPEWEDIPDPGRFDGTRSKLRHFVVKLRLSTAFYPNEQSKLCFAINCLGGDALDQVYHYVDEDGRVNLPNLASLITILDTAFGNPNRVAEAELKLQTMQQGTTEPTAVSEFVAVCHQLDMRSRALQDMPCPDTPQPRVTPRRQAASAAAAAASAVNTIMRNAAPTPSTATRTKDGPLDQLFPEARVRRLAECHCYRCGEISHMARDCPLGSRLPPRLETAPSARDCPLGSRVPSLLGPRVPPRLETVPSASAQ